MSKSTKAVALSDAISPSPPGMSFEEESVDGSSVTSIESFETEVWDNETVAAVSRTTHQQMLQRQPILIGCNRDGTINVQLPNGNIIVAEASAFPSFGAKLALQQTTNGAYDVVLQRHPPSNKSESAQIDKIPREEVLANMMPNEASAVFHIFQRRVNVRLSTASCHRLCLTQSLSLPQMDSFRPSSSNGVSTYELLRAWVQDDPYRYTFPDMVEDPASLQDQPPIDTPKVITATPPHHPIPTDTTLQDILRPSTTGTTTHTNDLLAVMVQRGKQRRQRMQQRLAARDRRMLQRMEERGFFRDTETY